MNIFNMFNTELLISEVEKRPALYDIQHRKYKDKSLKDSLWEEVAGTMFKNWNDKKAKDKKELSFRCMRCVNVRYVDEYFQHVDNTDLLTSDSEVEKRTTLYDIEHRIYKDTSLKDSLREVVADTMFKNWNDKKAKDKKELKKGIRVKWKSIRDQFTREVKAENLGTLVKKKKRYMYYDQLLFLKRIINSKQSLYEDDCENSMNSEPRFEFQTVEESSEIDEEVLPDDVEYSRNVERISRNPSESAISNRDKIAANQIVTAASDSVNLQEDVMGNKAFLMSLLPTMNQLTSDQSFFVRYKIMELMQQLRMANYQPDFNASQSHQCSHNTQACSSVVKENRSSDHASVSEAINIKTDYDFTVSD